MSSTVRIFPKWAASWAALVRSKALVRCQCRQCGMQQRVDASVQALRFGASASPVDQLDRCMVVGCDGATYFLVARTYGRQWLTALSREDLREAAAAAAPPANAVSLDLIRTR